MTADRERTWQELRFYGPLLGMILAWATMTLVVAGFFALPSAMAAILTYGGILAILGRAMKSPSYIRLKHK